MCSSSLSSLSAPVSLSVHGFGTGTCHSWQQHMVVALEDVAKPCVHCASPSFWCLTAQGLLWWARLAENPSVHTGSCWAVTEECGGGIRHIEKPPLQEQWFGHTVGCLQWPETTPNPQEFNQGLSQGLRMTKARFCAVKHTLCVCVSCSLVVAASCMNPQTGFKVGCLWQQRDVHKLIYPAERNHHLPLSFNPVGQSTGTKQGN